MTSLHIINAVNHLFVALFLSWLVGYTYVRAWELEHGGGFSSQDRLYGRNKKGKEFYIPPYPIVLLAALVLFFINSGFSGGLNTFFAYTADLMLAVSIYYALLIFLPVLRSHISARACAELWILPYVVIISKNHTTTAASSVRFVLYIPQRILDVLLPIWGIGFLVIFSSYLLSHLIFRHRILKTAVDETDAQILTLWNQVLEELDYKRPVRLVRAGIVGTPFSMGSTKRTRVTVLPVRPYTEKELTLIFRHELHHIQRNDANTKLYFAFTNALLWFHPLVWIASREAGRDLELACDELVLEYSADSERRLYADLLLNTAGERRGFTTCLSASASALHSRLRAVLHPRKCNSGTLFLMALVFFCVLADGSFAVTTERTTIGEALLSNDTSPDYVLYTSDDEMIRSDEALTCDEQKLYAYIRSLAIEPLTGTREYCDLEYYVPRLFLSLSPDSERRICIYDSGVTYYDRNGVRTFYHLRDPIDWENIKACFL